MIKHILFASAMMWQSQPNVPVTQPSANYPVQIRILSVRWNKVLGTYSGYGRADLIGADAKGIDFTYDCDNPFMANSLHGEFYQARWKKPEKELEILAQKIGSNHQEKCTLKTSVKSAAYAKNSATWTDPVPAGTPAPAPASGSGPAAVPPPGDPH